jgi:D-alanyl-D-alanine dipeptidase
VISIGCTAQGRQRSQTDSQRVRIGVVVFVLVWLGVPVRVTVATASLEDPVVRREPWPRETEDLVPTTKPQPSPPGWAPFVGEYGEEADDLFVLERGGRLWLLADGREPCLLREERRASLFTAAQCDGVRVELSRSAEGSATLVVGDRDHARRVVGPPEGAAQLRVQPVVDVRTAVADARRAAPPSEPGPFRDDELVEVTALDPTIRLDIRYASANNFLGIAFYAEPRAMLQKPAAEALVRVHRRLRTSGYGLLILDAYRPWFVTRAFWDATPEDKRWLVADPSRGSRHNRGAAVDLTLYDLAAGEEVEMPSTYDETTSRAYAFYPGGTALARWHRALLRQAMEAEGFTINLNEWWHFDFSDWREYRIGNRSFDQIR